MSDVFDKAKEAVAVAEAAGAALAKAEKLVSDARSDFDKAVADVEKLHGEFTDFVKTVVPSIGRNPRQL